MIQSLLHAFFPEVCLVCKRLLYEKEKHICLHCLYALPRTGFLHCKENELFMKLANRFPLESAQSLFFFHKNNGPVLTRMTGFQNKNQAKTNQQGNSLVSG